MIDLAGKNIVVTGAGRGLGRACAIGLAQSGASLVINDVDAQPLEEVVGEIKALGGKAVSHVADISDWESAKGLIGRCVAEFGSITGLVNNAALLRLALVDDLDPVELRALLDVNVAGSIFCAQHALREMRAAGGSIVNTVSGAQAGLPGMSVYSATKGAIASFTYTMAMEVAGTKVRVNAISPRAETRMREVGDDFRLSQGWAVSGAKSMTPEMNVPVYQYLLSDASRDVNGQVIRIDGTELSLCSHPSIMKPVLSRPEWSAESIAAAFERDLSQAPLGIRGDMQPG